MSGTEAAGARIRARIPALLGERPFRRYWGAQTISMFGDQVSAIALPLTGVLVLHASAAQMGYLTAIEWLPSLLFALHAGAWVDRRGHRRATMIVADIGRALLLSVPVCYGLGVLTLGQLYAVAFAAGTLSVLFTVSDATLFVALVDAGRYVEGQSLVYGSRALSFVGGPSAGGLLVQALSAPLALVADALSFLGSAFFLGRIRPAEPPAAGREKGALAAGLKFILRSRVTGAFQAINYGTPPLGSLTGGALGALLGLRPALWIATVGGALGFVWLLPSPLPRFRMPAAEPAGGSGPQPAAEPAIVPAPAPVTEVPPHSHA